MLNFGNKEFRNIQEQVLKNANDIAELKARPLLAIEIVDELPEEGEAGVLYLVPVEDGDAGNLYEEFVWVDEAWEQVGSTEIDLSAYPTLAGNNEFSGENSFGDVSVENLETRNITPASNSTYDIGADNKYYKEAKVNKYTVSASGYGFEKDGSDLRFNTGGDIKIKSSAGDNANVYVYPYSDGKVYLGKSNMRFSNVNTSAITNDYSALSIKGKGGISITCDSESSVRPSQNEQLYLGSDGSRWKRIYVGANGIDFGNNAWIQKDGSNRIIITNGGTTKAKFGGAETLFATKLSPDQSDTYDLGRTAMRWNYGYINYLVASDDTVIPTSAIAMKSTSSATEEWASGTLGAGTGEDTINISAQGVGMPEAGIYMFTYGNSQTMLYLDETMIQNAALYPIRVTCPVLKESGGVITGNTGNLKISRSNDILTIHVASTVNGSATSTNGWGWKLFKTGL